MDPSNNPPHGRARRERGAPVLELLVAVGVLLVLAWLGSRAYISYRRTNVQYYVNLILQELQVNADFTQCKVWTEPDGHACRAAMITARHAVIEKYLPNITAWGEPLDVHYYDPSPTGNALLSATEKVVVVPPGFAAYVPDLNGGTEYTNDLFCPEVRGSTPTFSACDGESWSTTATRNHPERLYDAPMKVGVALGTKDFMGTERVLYISSTGYSGDFESTVSTPTPTPTGTPPTATPTIPPPTVPPPPPPTEIPGGTPGPEPTPTASGSETATPSATDTPDGTPTETATPEATPTSELPEVPTVTPAPTSVAMGACDAGFEPQAGLVNSCPTGGGTFVDTQLACLISDPSICAPNTSASCGPLLAPFGCTMTAAGCRMPVAGAEKQCLLDCSSGLAISYCIPTGIGHSVECVCPCPPGRVRCAGPTSNCCEDLDDCVPNGAPDGFKCCPDDKHSLCGDRCCTPGSCFQFNGMADYFPVAPADGPFAVGEKCCAAGFIACGFDGQCCPEPRCQFESAPIVGLGRVCCEADELCNGNCCVAPRTCKEDQAGPGLPDLCCNPASPQACNGNCCAPGNLCAANPVLGVPKCCPAGVVLCNGTCCPSPSDTCINPPGVCSSTMTSGSASSEIPGSTGSSEISGSMGATGSTGPTGGTSSTP